MKTVRFCAFADEAGKDLVAQVKALKRNGLDLLEIRAVGDKNISDITREEAKEIKKVLDSEGISVWSLGSPIGKVTLDAADTHIEKFKRLLESADVFGCTHMRMFSYKMSPPECTAEAESRVMENLSKLVDIARGTGVLLCHENEKGIFGYNAENCAKIHKAFPEIKAVFDTANFVQCGVDTIKAWDILHPYVEYLHSKDAMDDGLVVPYGEGQGNVRYIVEKYLAQGGEIITAEPHLFEFKSLKVLETGETKTTIGKMFDDADTAFDAGVNAMKKITAEAAKALGA